MDQLGQLCGVLGTIITILQPQLRSKVHILLCCMLVNALNGLNFALIGQTGSAVFLCLVAIVQSGVSIWHERQGRGAARWEAALFFGLYTGFGLAGVVCTEGFAWALSWHNAVELLPTVGAVMLMLSVFARSAQKTRVFLLLNGAAWVIYSAAVGAAVFFSCVVSVISSAAALWKYQNTQPNLES